MAAQRISHGFHRLGLLQDRMGKVPFSVARISPVDADCFDPGHTHRSPVFCGAGLPPIGSRASMPSDDGSELVVSHLNGTFEARPGRLDGPLSVASPASSFLSSEITCYKPAHARAAKDAAIGTLASVWTRLASSVAASRRFLTSLCPARTVA
jgi:hypothetical protein